MRDTTWYGDITHLQNQGNVRHGMGVDICIGVLALLALLALALALPLLALLAVALAL